MARPSIELTKEMHDMVVGALKAGNYIETAAALVGIHHDTLRDWIKKGRKGDPRYEVLANDVAQAIASAEARDLAVIGKAANEHWQAAAWRLERRFNDRWGRKNDVSLSGKNGAPPLKMELIIDLDGTATETQHTDDEEDDDDSIR